MKEFKLDKIEEERATEFINKHLKSCRKLDNRGFPIGPLFSYIFTPYNVGTGITIKCIECEETKTLTNYDSW